MPFKQIAEAVPSRNLGYLPNPLQITDTGKKSPVSHDSGHDS